MKRTLICILLFSLLPVLASCGPPAMEGEKTDAGPDWNKQLTDYYNQWEFDNLEILDGQCVSYGLLKKQSDTLIVYLDGSRLCSVFGQNENGAWIQPGNAYLGDSLFHEYDFLTMDKINVKMGQDHTDDPAVMRYDTFENRVQSVTQIINAVLNENEYQRVFMYGVSEGALILPQVYSLIDSDTAISGIIVQGVGAYSQLKGFKVLGNGDLTMPPGWKEAYQQADKEIEKIKAAPESINDTYMGLPYLRWATYGTYSPADDFINIDVPILLLHGTLDVNSPVEGARTLADLFSSRKKDNLTYIEYEDMGHGPETAEQAQALYTDIITWIRNQ